MSFTITVTFKQGDLNLLSARFRTAASEVPLLMNRMLMDIGDESENALKNATPVGTGRTGGHLDESYTLTVAENRMTLSTDQAGKMNWVRHGTTTPIVPVRARYLRSPELPHPMLWVHGQDPHDFVTPVTDNVMQYTEDAITPFMDDLKGIIEG